MLRKVLILLTIVALSFTDTSCSYFETCDGDNYQIKEKIDLGNGLCTYKAQSITSCLMWNDMKIKEFTDTCDAYLLSYILPKSEIYEKYGI